jgi:hypothetical protein
MDGEPENMGATPNQSVPGSETIEVIGTAEPNGRWAPIIGPETLGLLEYFRTSQAINEESRASIRDEAVSILARCVPPDTAEQPETGLVIGYVQSGKTMSYTAVAALARDNGYRIVIAITGISVPLFRQSSDRLKRDLRLAERPDRKWQYFENPRPQGSDRRSIEDTLADWDDASVPEAEHQSVLITVMKNHTHLRNLIQVLSAIDLRRVPVLVIDDEADQAGLNTKARQNDESTTYQRLLELRGCLPQHTFLQYTATPQAPLLINIIDTLSPRFAEVLTPGAAYVGGREFFLAQPQLIRTVPPGDIPTQNNPLIEPPASLLEALRVFFVGVAAGLVQSGGAGNRSMMVHPSQSTSGHRQYLQWVTQTKDTWQQALESPPGDPDRSELIDDFRVAYEDLRSTVPDLPSFDALVVRLPHAIRRTRVEEVNAVTGRTPQVNWRTTYSHILVGGQAMDRGFTIEGLTITYMPRSAGVGNADTIQQRARFFGYKRSYIGFCRVYLERRVRDAYRSYVEHEEDVRERLLQHRATSEPLTEWKRAFFLTSALRPTRRNVLQLDYMQGTISDDWYAPDAPYDSADAVSSNRKVVQEFLNSLSLQEDEGDDRRTIEQRHQVDGGVALRLAYQDLLTKLRTTWPSDSQRFTGVLLQLGAYLDENPDVTCTVYQMSGGRVRRRSVDGTGEIKNLFQGANYDNGQMTYPGDRSIRGRSGLTIQVHTLSVRDEQGSEIAGDVPAIAIWVPAEMAADWLVQDPT